MTRIIFAFAIAIVFASMKSSVQFDKKENAITSPKTITTKKEDLCTNIEYAHTMLIEKFFVDALNIFKGIKPACICVQLCKDKPTYCYPNGCIHEVKKCIPNDDEDSQKSTVNSSSNIPTETDITSIRTTTISAPIQNFENSIFPDTTEEIEAIYIRQLLKPTDTPTTQDAAEKDCHSTTTPTPIPVSRQFSTQSKFNLWSKINQKRLPHPYVGPHFHTPQETTMVREEISTMATILRNIPQRIISEKTHWPTNDSLQIHSHRTYGEDHKENWLHEIFDDTYKSTMAQSDDYDTIIVEDEGVEKFQHSILANLHNEDIVNEYFDKNTYDKSTTAGINNNLRLAIPDFIDDYNTNDNYRENNFTVTPDVPIIKGKVTNRWGTEIDYAYDYTDNGTSRYPLNDAVVNNYSNDLNSEFGLRYTEPLYKSRETYSFYNTTEKLYPNTITVTERERLRLDRRSQVQNFSPFLADRKNYIERKTKNETVYLVKPKANNFKSDNLGTNQKSRARLPSTPYSTMYDDSDSEEEEYRVSRKYFPTTKAKPRQLKRRRQGNMPQRNKMDIKRTYYNNYDTENITKKPAERIAMLRSETNSPNRRVSTNPLPDIKGNLQQHKYMEKNQKIERFQSREPFSRLGKRDGLKFRPAEYNSRKRREKSFRNSRKFIDEVRTTTAAYYRRNSRDLRRNRGGLSKKGIRENRRMAHRNRFDRLKQAG